jgi:hypothetical protein
VGSVGVVELSVTISDGFWLRESNSSIVGNLSYQENAGFDDSRFFLFDFLFERCLEVEGIASGKTLVVSLEMCSSADLPPKKIFKRGTIGVSTLGSRFFRPRFSCV